MMNIIFLDIDGVMNHNEWYTSEERNKRLEKLSKRDINDYGDYLAPNSMKLLNKLIKETDSKVVISSTHRSGKTIEELQLLFDANGFEGTIIGSTPYLMYKNSVNKSVPRGCEIDIWLREYFTYEDYKNKNFSYVILDDDKDMLYEQRDNFIHIDSMYGLTEVDIDQAKFILN